ncbi:MAG: sigma factor-like helix-turn-helix DNA-binding protein [Clostridia bacterium]
MSSQLARTLRANRLYDLYSGLLTERQRRVVYLYYAMDLSLGEIAERLGVTRQAIHDSVMRALATLEEAESTLGFLDRWERVNLLAQRIEGSVQRGDYSSLADALEELRELNPLG